ncbi:DUF2975 domain-containing protein [Flavobacterium ichthyis]|nr:DUF2975 domain-containing protein [Flavobacterium ichthyis]
MSIIFLKFVLVLFGLLALFILIRFPLTEGRAENLDWISIYSDPFILYGYAVSIVFFVALLKAFRLLGYIGKNELYTQNALKALRTIKFCGIILSLSIVLAGIFIVIFHHEDDDPAGFLGLCIVATFISVVMATALAVLEKILQNVIEMKSENDLTI